MNADEDHGYTCHFCGTYLNAEGYENDVDAFDTDGSRKRHWLQDCRPDLVEHDEGSLCTWPLIVNATGEPIADLNAKYSRPGCYAYQDRATGKWGDTHVNFYPKDVHA